MDAIIDIWGSDLRCLGVAGGSEYRIDALEATSALRGFARRYERTLKDVDAQRSLGQEMTAWLDRTGWISHWLAQPGARRLCVQLASSDGGTALGLALLEAPWELLTAPGDDFLALDGVQPFLVLRRVGAPAEPWAPAYKNLSLLFMAAAPQGEHELDFEAEEAAILGATEKALVQLHVEETGSLEGLAYRVSADGPFEALHISCHGAQDSTLGAVLALENDYGACDLASPENLVACLDDTTRLPLLFLSACQTAEQVEGAEGFPVESFVRALLRAGVANVLGWDGSVRDADAILFAQSLYAALGLGRGLPEAVALARQGLLQAHLGDRSQGTHWHLARLYLGPAGGGALVSNKKPRHALLANQTHAQQFLDGAHAQVPVATRAAFVGRRREIQQALRLLQDETLPGVLIQGMGNLGKSSLAARIASRLTKHSPVVVFGRYDASTVFERMLAAVPASARSAYRNTWQATIDADESALADALETLLLGPELLEKPVLLVVDDLERILEQPAPGQALTPVSAGHRQALAALLRAFQQARSQGSPSCLLITSRYRFTLPDSWGANQAEALGVLPLRPMPLRERQKQFAAAQRLAALEPTLEQLTLAREAQALAEGNPGLQDILTKPILTGELAAARSAQGAIRLFLAQGPEGLDAQSLHDFFARMSFEHYTQALQPQERQVLRIACIFSPGQPIPQAALEAAAQACAMRTAPPAISRLLGLGLLDDWGCLDTPPVLHLSINPLARPLVIQDPLDEAPPAQAGLEVLVASWQTPDGSPPQDPRGVA
ncbi:MAG: CHAT domain-containing protein, partial [Zoogloea sp.]|uniref:CHAT domain-containing protein n=1 Tax=Zoogloea sp. TaxID=49181 RepID=UPI003F2D301C